MVRLQAANIELKGRLSGLEEDNAQLLAAQRRGGSTASLPVEVGDGEPADPTDLATLQSVLRAREEELAVLSEDNGAKEEELMHALTQLQVWLFCGYVVGGLPGDYDMHMWCEAGSIWMARARCSYPHALAPFFLMSVCSLGTRA